MGFTLGPAFWSCENISLFLMQPADNQLVFHTHQTLWLGTGDVCFFFYPRWWSPFMFSKVSSRRVFLSGPVWCGAETDGKSSPGTWGSTRRACVKLIEASMRVKCFALSFSINAQWLQMFWCHMHRFCLHQAAIVNHSKTAGTSAGNNSFCRTFSHKNWSPTYELGH